MDIRSQLYYILKEYIAGKYDTLVFCNAFYNLFYPNKPKKDLSDYEYAQFEKLAYATARFSEYDDDFLNYPKAYVSAHEIESIAKEIYNNLWDNTGDGGVC